MKKLSPVLSCSIYTQRTIVVLTECLRSLYFIISVYHSTLCFCLLTGCLATLDEPSAVSTDVGGEFSLVVNTLDADVTSCFLLTPNGELIQVMPTNKSADRYKVRERNAVFGCSVTVIDANENDRGIWQIYTESSEGDRTSSQRWIVAVNGSTGKYFFYCVYQKSGLDNVSLFVCLKSVVGRVTNCMFLVTKKLAVFFTKSI